MPDARLDALLEAAFHETLKTFDAQVARGEIDPLQQCAEFRRRRRDYASSLRMGQVPAEADALARQLLRTHGLEPQDAPFDAFREDVTRLLIRLYDAFIARSEKPQGNR